MVFGRILMSEFVEDFSDLRLYCERIDLLGLSLHEMVWLAASDHTSVSAFYTC